MTLLVFLIEDDLKIQEIFLLEPVMLLIENDPLRTF